MTWESWFSNEGCATRDRTRVRVAASIVVALALGAPVYAGAVEVHELVAKLDTRFQAAVKVNDGQTMDRILGQNMVLVLGNGSINTRAELLQEARDKTYLYERAARGERAGTSQGRTRW